MQIVVAKRSFSLERYTLLFSSASTHLTSQMLVNKITTMMTRTIKERGVRVANALNAFCPGNLQSPKMLNSLDMTSLVPLVPLVEWEHYIALPAQRPPPSTTAGRVEWWKGSLS